MGIATTPTPDAAEQQQQQQQQSPQAGDTDLTVTEIIDVPTGEAPEDAGQAEDDGVVTIATGSQTVDADIDFVPSVPEGVGEGERDVGRARLSTLEAIQETSWLSEFVAEEEEEDAVVVEEDDAEDDAEEDGQTADVNVHIPVEGAGEEQRDSNVEPFALDLALTREEEEPIEITIQIRRRSFISPGTYLSLFLTLMNFYFIFGKQKDEQLEVLESMEIDPGARNEGQEEGMDVDEHARVGIEPEIQAPHLESPFAVATNGTTVGEQQELVKGDEGLPVDDAFTEATRECFFHRAGYTLKKLLCDLLIYRD